MIKEIRRIAELQSKYSSKNTPAMKERGELIRSDLPESLWCFKNDFAKALGKFSADIAIEGSDGIGRKTQAPWVRIYSETLSPSATGGFYMVVHFSADGERCFVTIGCGASKWDRDKGDLIKYSDSELKAKVGWAKQVLSKANADISGFGDKISLGSHYALPKSFEKATVLCKTYAVDTVEEKHVVESVCGALQLLSIIYEAYSQRSDMLLSESVEIDLEDAVSPTKTGSGNRQGYGLSGPERKAVELCAMGITRDYLVADGFKVKDTSGNNPFDFLATKGGKRVKVEVKGTTSSIADSVMMTSNEVSLHTNEQGSTALAIVSGIVLDRSGKDPKCTGGELEYLYPWRIDDWELEPKAYLVSRP
ncbi:DUF3578 domain-containing protein [Gammaproteobacteria bacterium]|nr:DUF3578 domain-containing protein [Gammaproteobacteria bacterium]